MRQRRSRRALIPGLMNFVLSVGAILCELLSVLDGPQGGWMEICCFATWMLRLFDGRMSYRM